MHELTRAVAHDGVLDEVAVEEPLEIRVDGEPLAVTMRTPDHDEELALGFLYGEGLITEPHPAGLTEDFAVNTIEVNGPARARPVRALLLHHLLVRSVRQGCAGGGRGARAACCRTARRSTRALLADLPERLRQPGFARTGGLHATGLFTVDGELLIVREDVGRHNAMDKVIGRALRDGLLPLHGFVLCVSGRLCFELVQKAVVAGAPILVGVGAPTSLAVELAADRGLTLAGFARKGLYERVYKSGARHVAHQSGIPGEMDFQEHHFRNLGRARDALTETIVSLQSATERMTGDDWIDAKVLLEDITGDIGPRLVAAAHRGVGALRRAHAARALRGDAHGPAAVPGRAPRRSPRSRRAPARSPSTCRAWRRRTPSAAPSWWPSTAASTPR